MITVVVIDLILQHHAHQPCCANAGEVTGAASPARQSHSVFALAELNRREHVCKMNKLK